MSKASVPKGTRDFLPAQIEKREYLFQTIKSVYKKFGFVPIETPAMERLDTLTGKYGDEGDQLIFKILNSGDFMSKADKELPSNKLAPQISKRALRYDLTVPFARFVANHRNDITFPFKRYQIQPVWRADRPQKGRYQEFFQCDADVVGSDSLLHEVEFIQIFDEVLSQLGLKDFSVKVNNRKILAGLAEVIGHPDQLMEMTIALDKLDKIGLEKVNDEWRQRGLSEEAVSKLNRIFSIDGNKTAMMNTLTDMFETSELGRKGIEELNYVFSKVEELGLNKAKLELDLTLARGLNYYTGAIFEVATNEVQMGSICGGGRYDDLTGIFGLPDMSGVGISFGADRIYDVLNELELWPADLQSAPSILLVNFGEEELNYATGVAKQLREAGVSCEVYPSSAKMKKQMAYADKKGFPFVALIGSAEMEEGILTVKELANAEQRKLSVAELIEFLTH